MSVYSEYLALQDRNEALTSDFQVYYRGVTWGDGDHELVKLDIFNGAEVRSNDTDLPTHHGQQFGVDYASGRAVTMEVELWSDTAEGLQVRIQEWLAATTISEIEHPLIIKLPDWDDYTDKVAIDVRPRRRSGPVIEVNTVVGHMARASCQFWATDPRLYSESVQTSLLTQAESSGGLTFDATPDFTFGVAGSGGTAVIDNTGNFESWPHYTITGPITNPSIEITDQNGFIWTLSFNGTVGTNDELHIDSHPRNRTVLLNGSASRYFWLQDPNGWRYLEPGSNQVTFRGTTAGSPTLLVEYKSAWL